MNLSSTIMPVNEILSPWPALRLAEGLDEKLVWLLERNDAAEPGIRSCGGQDPESLSGLRHDSVVAIRPGVQRAGQVALHLVSGVRRNTCAQGQNGKEP
ncbi:hypothetical protein PAA8504_04074 [Palleronia abyssalis]|uniref:Uncharacterized protein n=2 Tax=Palleronia abyssalis TaxID=1501240 RepID=A0A2R8C1C4_9RHOB|nr:hypothetical protein PAA8504_04074 [Palleronia abyssalis]